MNKQIKKEILVGIMMVFIAILCVFYAITPVMYLTTHIIAIGFFVLFSFMIWQTKPSDERASKHRAISSDVAFTVGGTFLGIAMMFQIYDQGKIDVWLMVTLASMILSRIISQIWLNKNN